MQQLNNISTGLEVLAGFATLAAGYAMLKAFTASQRPSKLSADDKRQKLQQAATSIHRRFPSVRLLSNSQITLIMTPSKVYSGRSTPMGAVS
jgi:hypothetical protein